MDPLFRTYDSLAAALDGELMAVTGATRRCVLEPGVLAAAVQFLDNLLDFLCPRPGAHEYRVGRVDDDYVVEADDGNDTVRRRHDDSVLDVAGDDLGQARDRQVAGI